MLYVAITPKFSNVTRYSKVGDHELIYDKIMFLTQDHNVSADVDGWSDLASVGEIYEHEIFVAEIVEDE